MARNQENGTTILLGLKGYRVGEVFEEEEGIIVEVKATRVGKLNCPRGGLVRVRKEGCFMAGAMVRRFTLSYIASAGDAKSVVVPLMMAWISFDLIPE